MNFLENGKLNLEMVKEEIAAIIADIAELPVEEIGGDDTFVDDLGLDSLLALEVLAAIEKKFKVDIAEENLPLMQTLNATVEVAANCIKEKYNCA